MHSDGSISNSIFPFCLLIGGSEQREHVHRIHLFMINSEEKEHLEFFCSVLFFFFFFSLG